MHRCSKSISIFKSEARMATNEPSSTTEKMKRCTYFFFPLHCAHVINASECTRNEFQFYYFSYLFAPEIADMWKPKLIEWPLYSAQFSVMKTMSCWAKCLCKNWKRAEEHRIRHHKFCFRIENHHLSWPIRMPEPAITLVTSHSVSIVSTLCRCHNFLPNHKLIQFLLAVLFPRHTNKQTRENTINLIHMFRDYLHYHIKVSVSGGPRQQP